MYSVHIYHFILRYMLQKFRVNTTKFRVAITIAYTVILLSVFFLSFFFTFFFGICRNQMCKARHSSLDPYDLSINMAKIRICIYPFKAVARGGATGACAPPFKKQQQKTTIFFVE